MGELHPPESIETERLILRPVSTLDASAIFEYASHEEATKFMNFVRHRAAAEAEGFAQRCVDCWKSGDAFPWAICIKQTGDFAGVIELRIKPPKADFGYILRRCFWQQGYASEAASTVVAWACAQPKIFRVWATCHPQNIGSRRVLEKAGLTLEGTLHRWEARPNMGEKAGDSLCYALTRQSNSS